MPTHGHPDDPMPAYPGPLAPDPEPADFLEAVSLAVQSVDRERIAQARDTMRDMAREGRVFLVMSDCVPAAVAPLATILVEAGVRAVAAGPNLAAEFTALGRPTALVILIAPQGMTPEVQALLDLAESPVTPIILTNSEPVSYPYGGVVVSVASTDPAVVLAVHGVVCSALVQALAA